MHLESCIRQCGPYLDMCESHLEGKVKRVGFAWNNLRCRKSYLAINNNCSLGGTVNLESVYICAESAIMLFIVLRAASTQHRIYRFSCHQGVW